LKTRAEEAGANPAKSHLDRAREVFEIEMEGLRAVRAALDEGFDRVVRHLCAALEARGKIVLVGVGKSGNVGAKIAATLTSTGATAVVLNSVDALHGDLGIVNDGDVALALSNSGETEELLNLIPALKRRRVGIVAMTANPGSTLGRHSDFVLNVKVPREACPFNLAPTASTTAMLAMGDALAMAVLEARGFTREDFARHHPSGAIGRALLLRVADIMRTGARNPVARQDQTVQEGLLAMTRAKSGGLSVVDGEGKLRGVFTDGDLRRLMTADTALLGKRLEEVMTRRPVHIGEGALAVEAVKVFEERGIDDLIVVNQRMEPVGMIDSQDLPRLKMM